MPDKKIIVVVDDITANLTAAKKALSGAYQVYAVPSAYKLLALLDSVRPDLILLDILMPEMTGYEAAKIIKENDDFREY